MPGELSPGSTPRRWVPEGGERKHREKIHRESSLADGNKNLPFTFSKPQNSRKAHLFQCSECGNSFFAPKRTIMCICSKCKKVTKVELVNG